MTTTTNYTISTSNSKHETAKMWLQRHLRKAASKQTLKGGDEDDGTRRWISPKRPRTAPSRGTAIEPFAEPPLPFIPINIERASLQPSIQLPPRPSRPDPGVMRDVNAWLEASISSPSPPLMGGLSYWRTATIPGVKDSASVQHAIPIVGEPETVRPSTSHSQQVKSFRRHTKRLQVQMPSMLRTKSQRSVDRKQMNRRSPSMPLLAIRYEETQSAGPPRLLIRSRSFLRPVTRPSTSDTTTQSTRLPSAGHQSLERLLQRHGTLADRRLNDGEHNIERRVCATFRPMVRSTDNTRPSTAVAAFMREESVGDLSDAPTYFTGPLPPSYRSHTASILTTSSFGCIDGMNSTQRQLSQQRAAQRRGLKAKLKKFALKFKT
ncbi:uncharacterized protein K460DRAFT_270226 [Cucurbitaria berberidis CBS 394.84]|uniref:Uncharacterized protein n=1 Tax=Cucurbitaria berberidis CBS 394.84 TaxID=1168544 RepID=A0A9P4GRV3_9PLEO|nr:uncharacterized protein K460DRAFT_270226 [Cucurbitaria berberidis CBS 394.84]KAF1850379.1 hypothetical protein K460DRAFT_270226 [Cucurbitaria berberidis CBS 394.84]